MKDKYFIDLEGFSLEKFKHILETRELLPSRRILKEGIDQHFETLASLGINNLKSLVERLKNKKKMESLSRETGIPANYLAILRREANSYLPKPANLADIPGISPVHIEQLSATGIKNSKHLLEQAHTKGDRHKLSLQTGVPIENLEELVKLSDMLRINGVGPVFARVILDAGFDNIEIFVNTPIEKLFIELKAAYLRKGYTRADFTERDVQYCAEYAKELPAIIDL